MRLVFLSAYLQLITPQGPAICKGYEGQFDLQQYEP